MLDIAAFLFLTCMVACGFFLLFFQAITLFLVWVYARHRGPDPKPGSKFAEQELPCVTIQLPIRNEGTIAERIIRLACELDYPLAKLEIQVLDDSDDATSELVDRTATDIRAKNPAADICVLRRNQRTGFKAGALKMGTASAKGEFLAVFDADFLIPPDFLRRTMDYFTDREIGVVQARWAYVNRHHSLFTAFQATKLDSHQMFEQTARARSGGWVHFHGTAGIFRREALLSAGGWNCISEVEDIEVSIRAYLKGWKFMYLDGVRISSELPETVRGYLTQQMRWKRGWIRVLAHYGPEIWRADAPLFERLDILERLTTCFGHSVSLPFILGILPTFYIAESKGLWLPVFAMYATLLVFSLLQRFAEKYFIDDREVGEESWIPDWLLGFIPLGLIFNMGMTWPMTQSTFEGLGGKQRWEITPKSGALAAATGGASTTLTAKQDRIPGYIYVTAVLAALAVVLVLVSLWLRHPIAGLFYGLFGSGCWWLASSYILEWHHSTSR